MGPAWTKTSALSSPRQPENASASGLRRPSGFTSRPVAGLLSVAVEPAIALGGAIPLLCDPTNSRQGRLLAKGAGGQTSRRRRPVCGNARLPGAQASNTVPRPEQGSRNPLAMDGPAPRRSGGGARGEIGVGSCLPGQNPDNLWQPVMPFRPFHLSIRPSRQPCSQLVWWGPPRWGQSSRERPDRPN